MFHHSLLFQPQTLLLHLFCHTHHNLIQFDIFALSKFLLLHFHPNLLFLLLYKIYLFHPTVVPSDNNEYILFLEFHLIPAFCYLSISGIPYTVAFYFSHRHFTHSVIFPVLTFSHRYTLFFQEIPPQHCHNDCSYDSNDNQILHDISESDLHAKLMHLCCQCFIFN